MKTIWEQLAWMKFYECKKCSNKPDWYNETIDNKTYRKDVALNMYTKNYKWLCQWHYYDSLKKETTVSNTIISDIKNVDIKPQSHETKSETIIKKSHEKSHESHQYFNNIWDLHPSHWFSKAKAFRWLKDGKIIKDDNWYYLSWV